MTDMARKFIALRAELEETLAELIEEARLNGMGSEREAKLLAERDAANALLRKLCDERWATSQHLRACIAEFLERQS